MMIKGRRKQRRKKYDDAEFVEMLSLWIGHNCILMENYNQAFEYLHTYAGYRDENGWKLQEEDEWENNDILFQFDLTKVPVYSKF